MHAPELQFRNMDMYLLQCLIWLNLKLSSLFFCWFYTLSDANNLDMFLWAHGKQEMWFNRSQSDLPRILFERDCSVEDELQ